MLREVARWERLGHLATGNAEQDVIVLKKRGLRCRYEFRVVDGRVGHRRRWRLSKGRYRNSSYEHEHQSTVDPPLHGLLLFPRVEFASGASREPASVGPGHHRFIWG
jgi:hypothetical protein